MTTLFLNISFFAALLTAGFRATAGDLDGVMFFLLLALLAQMLVVESKISELRRGK